MKKTKKLLLIVLCISLVSSVIALHTYAYQLGAGQSGTSQGIDFVVYCYRHAPNTDDISCEAISDTTVPKIEARVYYLEYSKPSGAINKGSLVYKSNAKGSGDSTISGTTNPTHVKGWMRATISTNVKFSMVKDYTFSNHSAVSFLCKLCDTDVDGN